MLLTRADLDPVKVLTNELSRVGVNFNEKVVSSVAISIKYKGYIKRVSKELEFLEKKEKKVINWVELSENNKISNECRQRIKKIRPKYFSQLRRIDGIRPATIAYIATLID